MGLCVERSPDLIVGVLGILKAGGAYLPLDAGYPDERLAFMLADAVAPVLVTQSGLRARLEACGVDCVVCLDGDGPAIARQPPVAPRVAVDPQSSAYVIYTSGSTGTPKGVLRLASRRGASGAREPICEHRAGQSDRAGRQYFLRRDDV